MKAGVIFYDTLLCMVDATRRCILVTPIRGRLPLRDTLWVWDHRERRTQQAMVAPLR